MKNVFSSLLLVCSGLILSACSGGSSDAELSAEKKAEKQQVVIMTVNNPLYYFSQQLAGDFADIILPAPAGGDPAGWHPAIEDILSIQKADLIVLNSPGYSSWLDKVSLSTSVLLDSSHSITSHLIELTEETTHSHGPGGEHSHSGFAITTWMDMDLATQQVIAIADSLVHHWPAQQEAVTHRKMLLLTELEKLDVAYQLQSQKLADRDLIFSHPVYQYFKERYHLTGLDLHWEADEMPTAKQWHALEVSLTDKSLFIWEDTPSESIAEKMQSMGLDYIVIKPAANRTEKSWLEEQQANVQNIQACCSK